MTEQLLEKMLWFFLPKLNFGIGGAELVTQGACCDHRQTNYSRP
jgi:hypothetical protein